MFLVCNPVSLINFFYTLHTVKVQLLFALAHQCTLPSWSCTFSVHSNVSLLHTLTKRGAKEVFAISKIKTIRFHLWFIFSFSKKKIKVLQSILDEYCLVYIKLIAKNFFVHIIELFYYYKNEFTKTNKAPPLRNGNRKRKTLRDWKICLKMQTSSKTLFVMTTFLLRTWLDQER